MGYAAWEQGDIKEQSHEGEGRVARRPAVKRCRAVRLPLCLLCLCVRVLCSSPTSVADSAPVSSVSRSKPDIAKSCLETFETSSQPSYGTRKDRSDKGASLRVARCGSIHSCRRV